MNVGAELDRAVAEALGERLGWMCPCTACEFLGEGEPPPHCPECWAEGCTNGSQPRRIDPPPYSTSWEAAGRLVEELRGRGWAVVVSASGGRLPGEEYAATVAIINGPHLHASAPTLPHALALAALKALGGGGKP